MCVHQQHSFSPAVVTLSSGVLDSIHHYHQLQPSLLVEHLNDARPLRIVCLSVLPSFNDTQEINENLID